MRRKRILLIEDEATLAEVSLMYLKAAGYEAHWAENAEKGWEDIQLFQPDLILLDIQLPGESGLALAKRYRKQYNGIVIFISGFSETAIKLQGFDSGADDYMTKPFDPQELLARIKVHLRRHVDETENHSLTFGNLTIDLESIEVRKDGVPIELYAKEKQLLFFLAQHPNKVFSSEHLFNSIWGFDSESDANTVFVHISNLRKKIEDTPKKPRYIQTVRGFGYKLVP
ncbi:response regulator transcription factor [Bacillus sp. REN10]|uniref:response regulator transcription factor n=1 Tax=Bacillus sp. REN10 TaxID=2782541 RepID=UPI00193B7A6B|nr:response regulator transcription factor [Bacillus sp. REN10]